MSNTPLSSALDLLTMHVRELTRVLEAEHRALLEPDWQSLTHLSQQKRRILENLTAVDERLTARPMQTDDFYEPLHALKEYAHKDTTFGLKLQRLSSLLKDCQQLNRENREVASIRLRQTSQLLDLFSVCGLGCRPLLYGSAGHAIPYPNGRDLATA